MGKCTLGSLATFLHSDDKLVARAGARSATPKECLLPSVAKSRAQLEKQYPDDLQYSQARCPRHMHQTGATTKGRVLPNGCRAKATDKRVECTHGSTRVERLDATKPLLSFKAIGKKKQLRCTGNRNVLGILFGLYNGCWLNGIAAVMCVAFAGNNSDVIINPMPSIADTHGSDVRTGHCATKSSDRRMIRMAPRGQAMPSGYFSRYIVKVQPAGQREIKKCIDTMRTLRERVFREWKTVHQQQQAVTVRMVSDLD